MSGASGPLEERIAAGLAASVDPAVAEFAAALGAAAGARAVLFYGSNLRTGSLEGVLDFYVLLPGTGEDEAAIWPTVSYHERPHGDVVLRAKVATMRLATFARAAGGDLTDTTIWARFVQPSALVWTADENAHDAVVDAIAAACTTAARLAAALGPESGTADDYWRALFRATYEAEFRVEKSGRENDILSVNAAHFAGLLPLALEAGGIPSRQQGERLSPDLPHWQRGVILKWWARRRRMGKPLNLLRLVKASTTFEGATRYAAWKIERHTGMPVEVTPFRERHPLLAAPGVLYDLWRHRRRA
ncbi:hypothetical protein OIK40_13910 [Erythrobacter sp. sf7]|uniref:Adenylyltransferase AadA C-terminal domain-containing protein n=1 Tax=Erythrobacter fulvus TaxID=2987523 RepID=A0ABT5JUL1_9SPHN|nr:hypothetical protein [Erythrobacter fulvus]MDC8755741.1 hypothetical protein [Erythrobacter fulvus]